MEKRTQIIVKMYQHKFNPSLTCEIISETQKGFKTRLFTNGKKPKIQYFNSIDFDDDKGYWKLIEE